MTEKLSVPQPHPAAYDAYVTQLVDTGIGGPARYDVELWLPHPDGGGVVIAVDGDGAPLAPSFGRLLATQLQALQVDHALMLVRGVPLPDWACALYAELVDEAAGAVSTLDLLGVDGFRWESWMLSRPTAA
ncbi:MAG TPA: hypothetical protein VNA14_04295 [Mycobacteriales bacterium]|nr:hypothetical protein [Mycobacteriales bacterium]